VRGEFDESAEREGEGGEDGVFSEGIKLVFCYGSGSAIEHFDRSLDVLFVGE